MTQNLRNRVWLQLTGDARGGGRLTGANWALAAIIVLAVKLAGKTPLTWSVATVTIVALLLAGWAGLEMAVILGAGV